MAALALTALCTNAAKAGYLYVSTTDWTPTTGASVNLPINAQSGVTMGEHSLFEMAMQNDDSDNVGNTIEVGITTDLGLNGDEAPHWFVFSWISGTGQGYDSSSHFVSDIGNFWSAPLTLDEGTSERVGFQYSAGNWWLTLDGTSAGYFPGSEWSGAFTETSNLEVYGEVYQTGTSYPTMNGTVSGYESLGGGNISSLWADSPYVGYNGSDTGFSAEGPVPEPSTYAMMAAGVGTLLAFKRRRRS